MRWALIVVFITACTNNDEPAGRDGMVLADPPSRAAKAPAPVEIWEPPVLPSPDARSAQCGRSSRSLMDGLGKQLAKINFCVQDEMTRNPNGLGDRLDLSFVVTPAGATEELAVLNPAYPTKTLSDCLEKAFKLVRFDPAQGGACPMTLPIKIR